jgi:RNA polymerase sigma-70 factor (ECF subfamily)
VSLTADVFLAGIDAAGTHRSSRRSPSAWLHGTACHVVSAEHRHAGRTRRAEGRVQGRRLLDPDDVARMEERIDADAQARAMHTALEALPDGERALFGLVAVDGLCHAETAAAFGIRAVAARVRLHRASASLRARLTSPSPLALEA